MTAKIKLNSASGGGSFSLQAPSSSSNNRVIALPDIADGTLLTSQSTLDSTKLSPAITQSKILQVVTTHKASAFATTSGSFVDITGMSRAITPTSASSKIHIVLSLHIGGEGDSFLGFNLLRGSTVLSTGSNAYGNITGCTFGSYIADGNHTNTLGYTFLDSPNTTSATTYKLQMGSFKNTREVCINRTSTGSNSAFTINGTSTITLMEVAA